MGSYRYLHLQLMVTALALVALACGAAQQPGPVSGDDQPKYGGTVNLSRAADPFDFDVSTTGQGIGGADFIRSAYSSLLRVKIGPDIGYSQTVVEPGLAERWEVSSDARTYTFHLRKGVKFADLPPVNGRELTAADVLWSYQYWSRTGPLKDAGLPTSQLDWAFEGVERLESPDPYTVVVRFKDGFAPFLNYAASALNPIVPREIYAQDGHFKNQIVGTGPFQLDTAATQKGSRWITKKNPTYWDQGKPYLDEVRFLIISDDATLNAAFQTKQIDVIAAPDFRFAQDIARSNPNAVQYEWQTSTLHLWLNFKRPPLDDFRIREAFSLGIDRDELIKTVADGKGEWALANSNLYSDLFTQGEIKSFIKFDPERAKRLVQEAGYPNGLEVPWIISSLNAAQVTAPLIQAQLKKVGINIVFDVVPSGGDNQARRARTFSIAYVSGELQRPDVDGWLYSSAIPGGGFNYAGIDDPKVTELLIAQRREPDPAKRRELLRQVLRMINEKFLSIATYRTSSYDFWHPHLKNYYLHSDLSLVGGLWEAWLAK